MADYAGLDYDQLAQASMRLLEERGSGFRGISHEGAGYTSKDPGTERYAEGEASRDVGLLDPVDLLAGMLASKGATLARQGAQSLKPRPGVPRTGGRGIMRSERGSTGGGWWDEAEEIFPSAFPESSPARPPASLPDDSGIPPAMRPDIHNVRERIRAGMVESLEHSGGYDDPYHVGSMEDELIQWNGEGLLSYLKRLARLEQEYNPDQIYGPGEYPPSRLPDILDDYLKTPVGRAEAATIEAGERRTAEEAAARIKAYDERERRINPYQVGEGPLKRTIEVNDIPPPPQPARANEYADIIRKLFEREGQ